MACPATRPQAWPAPPANSSRVLRDCVQREGRSPPPTTNCTAMADGVPPPRRGAPSPLHRLLAGSLLGRALLARPSPNAALQSPTSPPPSPLTLVEQVLRMYPLWRLVTVYQPSRLPPHRAARRACPPNRPRRLLGTSGCRAVTIRPILQRSRIHGYSAVFAARPPVGRPARCTRGWWPGRSGRRCASSTRRRARRTCAGSARTPRPSKSFRRRGRCAAPSALKQ